MKPNEKRRADERVRRERESEICCRLLKGNREENVLTFSSRLTRVSSDPGSHLSARDPHHFLFSLMPMLMPLWHTKILSQHPESGVCNETVAACISIFPVAADAHVCPCMLQYACELLHVQIICRTSAAAATDADVTARVITE